MVQIAAAEGQKYNAIIRRKFATIGKVDTSGQRSFLISPDVPISFCGAPNLALDIGDMGNVVKGVVKPNSTQHP